MPLLFMGEEYGELAPFQYFTDHIDPDIAQATREGRRSEFASFAQFGADIPDPEDPASFERSKLTRQRDHGLARLYRELIVTRRRLPRGTPREIEYRRARALADRPPRALRDRLQLRERRRDHPVRRGDDRADRGERRAFERRIPQTPGDVRSAGPMTEVWHGVPFPLGATWDGQGTNFSIFSEHAESVQLCLFDDDGTETAIDMPVRHALNWHCYLPGVGPGQRYGYRVHGPYAPNQGHRFNPFKLLIDPYAKAIEGLVDWDSGANVLPYVPPDAVEDTGEADLELDDEDDAVAMPKSVVIDGSFDWEGDRPPRRPVHRHDHLRDPRQGVHHAPSRRARGPARHLCRAGVRAGDRATSRISGSPRWSCSRSTTSATSPSCTSGACSNYWGYSTIGYLAPHSEYAATGRRGEQVREFKGMVKALHRAGIEVILDVVYNHTAEGNHLGPMLSFKGVDNACLLPADARRPAALHGLHRDRQLAQPGPPRACCG